MKVFSPRPSPFLILLSSALLFASLKANAQSIEEEQSPLLDGVAASPNIILIMADDMGWSDLGCYGGEIDTPNIDRLADEGLLFTQFYNNAKCTTTRASLLTGLYPRNGGKGQHELIQKNMLTLGEALRHAGYATAMSGKWHNGQQAPYLPVNRGFDDAYGLWDGACNFFNPKIPDPDFKGGRTRPFGHNLESFEYEDFPDDYYTTDAFTTHAINFIKDHVYNSAGPSEQTDQPHSSSSSPDTGKRTAPFFLYLPYTAPHYPLHAKPEDIAKYKGRYSQGWDQLRQDRLQKQIDMALINPEWSVADLDDRATPWSDLKSIDPEWQQRRMETYAAMIDSMDQNIGRLLDTLDELKIARNTIVIFLADNGGCAETPGGSDPEQIPGPKEFYTHVGPGWASASNTPFRRYKQYAHEGGIATPFVVRWPAVIEPSDRTNQVGHIIDLLPTFLDVAKAKYPETHPVFGEPTIPLEGRSLFPIFEGTLREPHNHLFWHWAGNRAVRKGDWKLVWDRHEKKWELYNMAIDRTEAHDLRAKHPQLVEELTEKWFAWADETGVKVK
ncbi:MAG: arylsulfatase [Verrucomicrobiota bacterium]